MEPYEEMMKRLEGGVIGWEAFGRACLSCLGRCVLNDIATDEFGIAIEEEVGDE